MAWFKDKKTTSTPPKDDKKTDEKPAKVKVEKKSMKELYASNNKEQTKNNKTIKDNEKESSKSVQKQKIAYRVLIRPLITEKLNLLKEQGKYGFEVVQNTNKIEVGKAIEEIYGIKPSDVNIIRIQGKKVRKGRITGKQKDWKKAIITLPKGKNLEIFKGI